VQAGVELSREMSPLNIHPSRGNVCIASDGIFKNPGPFCALAGSGSAFRRSREGHSPMHVHASSASPDGALTVKSNGGTVSAAAETAVDSVLARQWSPGFTGSRVGSSTPELCRGQSASSHVSGVGDSSSEWSEERNLMPGGVTASVTESKDLGGKHCTGFGSAASVSRTAFSPNESAGGIASSRIGPCRHPHPNSGGSGSVGGLRAGPGCCHPSTSGKANALRNPILGSRKSL